MLITGFLKLDFLYAEKLINDNIMKKIYFNHFRLSNNSITQNLKVEYRTKNVVLSFFQANIQFNTVWKYFFEK